MHYVRCLRAPKVTPTPRGVEVELVFIISTDLGDSLLFPDTPIALSVSAHLNGTSLPLTPVPPKGKQRQTGLSWTSGQRVVKQVFSTPAGVTRALAAGQGVPVCIAPTRAVADSAEAVLRSGSTQDDEGLIMPVWVTLRSRVSSQAEEDEAQTSTRRLRLPRGTLEIGEDVGEPKSLARHVWDGGVVTVCALAGQDEGPCIGAVRGLLARGGNVLELGCGVGVLGLGTALVAAPGTTLVMTDLADAEEQVRSNMGRVLPLLKQDTDEEGDNTKEEEDDAEEGEEDGGEGKEDRVDLLYENLDWEDGREGRFGPSVASRAWDLVMFSDCTYNVDVLPALVGTLDALDEAAARAGGPGPAVLMATKPRHDSETEVFDMLARSGWARRAEQTIGLPVMGGEAQRVDLYLWRRAGRT